MNSTNQPSNITPQTDPNQKNFKIKTHTHNGKNRETHNHRPPWHHPSLPIHSPHQTQTISTIQHHMIYCSNPNRILKIKTHTHDAHDGKLQIVTLPLPPTTCLNPATAATILEDPDLIAVHILVWREFCG